MKAGYLAVTLVVGLLAGCTTTPPEMEFSAAPGTLSRYQNGNLIEFKAPDTNTPCGEAVALRHDWTEHKDIYALVWLKNAGTQSVNFSESNVQATMDGKNLHVAGRDEVERDIAEKAQAERRNVAIAAALGGFAAAQPTTQTGYGSGSVVGSGGYATYSGSYYGSTYNPAATAQADAEIGAESQQRVNAINQQQAAAERQANILLTANTIDPGKTASGLVRINWLRPHGGSGALHIVVTGCGQQQNFIFQVKKLKSSE